MGYANFRKTGDLEAHTAIIPKIYERIYDIRPNITIPILSPRVHDFGVSFRNAQKKVTLLRCNNLVFLFLAAASFPESSSDLGIVSLFS